MTAPLTPNDLDLRDFAFMPLDVMRLIDSDLTALASGDEFKAAVILWCKSWHQVPAASLPDDDRLLAHLAGYGRDVRGWRKVREMALRGFVKCDDGRLYHPVIAEKALEAGEAKRKQRERTVAATNARRTKNPQRDDAQNVDRDVQRDGRRDDDRDDVRNVHQGTGTGIGTVEVELGYATAREPLTDLEAKLREAAGWQNESAPMLLVVGPIQSLIDGGADLDLDVLPIVKALAPKARSRKSWKYFSQAIVDARDDRIASLTAVSSPTSQSRSSHERPVRSSQQRKSTLQLLQETFGGESGEGGPDVG